jgi:hypothetical protein
MTRAKTALQRLLPRTTFNDVEAQIGLLPFPIRNVVYRVLLAAVKEHVKTFSAEFRAEHERALADLARAAKEYFHVQRAAGMKLQALRVTVGRTGIVGLEHEPEPDLDGFLRFIAPYSNHGRPQERWKRDAERALLDAGMKVRAMRKIMRAAGLTTDARRASR